MIEFVYEFLKQNLFIVSFLATLFIVFSVRYKKVRKLLYITLGIAFGVFVFLVINKLGFGLMYIYMRIRMLTYIVASIFSLLQASLCMHKDFYLFILNSAFEYYFILDELKILHTNLDLILFDLKAYIFVLKFNIMFKIKNVIKNIACIETIKRDFFKLRL
ncbi:MAG: hypothetical protein K6E20_02520 [Acholeplasmatales bacterium]|nr:hypothetical protein [Acholeplasmatales bacterium]